MNIQTPFSKLRTLLIDDMAQMRAMLRTYLGQLAIEKIDQAGDAASAIQAMEKVAYDLVICDYNLNTHTDGQQLLEYARGHGLLPASALFIMVTAEAGYARVASASEMQPDTYLLKPFTAAVLESRLSSLLEKQSALADIRAAMAGSDATTALAACDLLKDTKWAIEAERLRGRILLDGGRPAEALEVYDRLLRRRHDLPWARLGHAQALMALGKTGEAETVCHDLVADNPYLAGGYDLLASLQAENGRHRAALATMMRAEERVPSARRSRATAHAAVKAGDLETAKGRFESVIAASEGALTRQESDFLDLGHVYLDAGEPDKSLGTVSRVSRNASQGVKALKSAIEAHALHRLDRHDEAAAALECAVRLAEGNPDVAVAVARNCLAMGRTEEAQSVLVDAVRSDDSDELLQKATALLSEANVTTDLVGEEARLVREACAEVAALVRGLQLDEAVAAGAELARRWPKNPAALVGACQAHLLWLSRNPLRASYVAEVQRYLTTLKQLRPGDARTARLESFLANVLRKARDAM